MCSFRDVLKARIRDPGCDSSVCIDDVGIEILCRHVVDWREVSVCWREVNVYEAKFLDEATILNPRKRISVAGDMFLLIFSSYVIVSTIQVLDKLCVELLYMYTMNCRNSCKALRTFEADAYTYVYDA
jgi:hypothetical protein